VSNATVAKHTDVHIPARRKEYVRNKFPNVSDAKIKVGIFIGPQIRKQMQDKQFD